MKNLSKKEIKRLSLKDERTFRKLYLLYKERMHLYIGRKQLKKEEIDLIIYESFLKIISLASEFDYETGNFDSFVFSIVRVTHTNFLRKYYQINNTELLSIDAIDNIAGKYDSNVLPLSYILCDLNKILSNEESDIIIYHDVYNEKFKDIASNMRISKYYVYLIYKRAQLKMKKYYGNK